MASPRRLGQSQLQWLLGSRIVALVDAHPLPLSACMTSNAVFPRAPSRVLHTVVRTQLLRPRPASQGRDSLQVLHHHWQLRRSFARLSTTPTLAQSTAANKISSRTEQIARHISSGSSSSQNNINNHNTVAKMSSAYQVRKVGAPNTLEHRIYIEKDGVPVSPFHDIPLYANQEQTILNMVVEIPRWTNGKLEVRCLMSNLFDPSMSGSTPHQFSCSFSFANN